MSFSRERKSSGEGTWIRNRAATNYRRQGPIFKCEMCVDKDTFVQQYHGVQAYGHPMVYVHIVDKTFLCGPVLKTER